MNAFKQGRFQALLAIILAGLLMAGISIISVLSQGTIIAMPAESADSTEAPVDFTQDNCRYGATIPNRVNQGSWMPTLEAGWYNTFNMWGTYPPDDNPYPGPLQAVSNALSSQLDTPVNDTTFVPVVRVKQDIIGDVPQPTYTFEPPLAAIPHEIQAYSYNYPPGTVWLIGNEPDVGPGQDYAHPEVYAQAYHEAYHFLKSIDPSYRIGIGSMAQATPGRLQYLSLVWTTYQQMFATRLPVDVWNLHLYILPEINADGSPADGRIAIGTDSALAIQSYNPLNGPPEIECLRDDVYCRAEHDSIDIFIDQIVAFRTWMRDHGERVKPLIISEYSILYQYNTDSEGNCLGIADEFGNCFTPERVKQFMEATFEYFETAVDQELGYPYDNNKLVQEWAWHSLQTNGSGQSSNLLKDNYANFTPGDIDALSEIGAFYREQVLTRTLYVDLDAINTFAPSKALTRTLTVQFVNNGNVATTEPITVTFYSDELLTQEIDSVLVEPHLKGCVQQIPQVSVEWLEDLPTGPHFYWVKLDSSDVYLEPDETDNVTRGLFIVDGHYAYTPTAGVLHFNPDGHVIQPGR